MRFINSNAMKIVTGVILLSGSVIPAYGQYDQGPYENGSYYSDSDMQAAQEGCNHKHAAGGALLGGVLGAVAGAAIGGRYNHGAGAVAGGMIGAAIGGSIGSELDQDDCIKFIAATHRTLETGEQTTWSGGDSHGYSRPLETTTQTQTAEYQVEEDHVDVVPALVAVRGQFVAVSSGNVRSGPATTYKVVGAVNKGDRIDILGKVKDAPWYMTGERGVSTGYVSMSVVKPTGKAAAKVSASVPHQNVKVVSASVETTCRSVEQSVTMSSGQTKTQTMRACQNPDGSWTTA